MTKTADAQKPQDLNLPSELLASLLVIQCQKPCVSPVTQSAGEQAEAVGSIALILQSKVPLKE